MCGTVQLFAEIEFGVGFGQGLDFSPQALPENLVGIAAGMDRTVCERLLQRFDPAHGSGCRGGDRPFAESFPDVIGSRFGRMGHIPVVKALVPQIVHHDFVSRKITAVGKPLPQGMCRHDQRCFAQLVFGESVPQVAYRTDGENNLFILQRLGTRPGTDS